MKTLTIGFFIFAFSYLGYQQVCNPSVKNNLACKIELNLLAYKAR